MGKPSQEPESPPSATGQDQFAKTGLGDMPNEDGKVEEMKSNAIAWISSPAKNKKLLKQFIKEGIDDTGWWLFEDDGQVSKWLVGKDESVSQPAIWLHGPHGFGKTVLASHATHKLETLRDKEPPCIPTNSKTYYSYYDKHSEHNTYLDILKGILHQMVEQDENAVPVFEKMSQEGFAPLSDAHTAELLIENIVQYPRRRYIIIDGLNKYEPSEGHRAIKFFANLATACAIANPGLLRIMLVSGSNNKLQQQMDKTGVAAVLLKPGDNAEDIKAFVESQLSNVQLPFWIKELIQKKICKESESSGSFLYARLTTEAVSRDVNGDVPPGCDDQGLLVESQKWTRLWSRKDGHPQQCPVTFFTG
ncbi:hypothetical protein NCS52_01546200 [Fusarium sp. LHS14.1]|nr:hypothetical protein NCS52_01546200 [Fusarium sp. LHS14.1]